MVYDNSFQKLGLSDLLDQDLTSYEFFHALPKALQQRIMDKDFGSFEDMAAYAAEHRHDVTE